VRFGGPGCGRKVSDALDGQMSKSWQHIGQIFADRNFESAAAFDNGENGGHARAALGAADVDPVFSARRDSTDILPISVKN
jgi:hypothetical protein